MQLSVDITNFTAGELSPRMKGRFDFKKYYNACDTALNMVVMPQGGVTRKPGTLFVGLNKAQATKNRLKEFIFSNQQPYMLEFSNLNVRIYKNDAVVLSGGFPVDVTTPYHTADLAALKFAQSADTLFIAHPSYPPAQLTRSSDTSWTYSVLTFLDGPYLNENTDTSNKVTPSATTGSITLTWDNTNNINKGAGFTSADIGRFVRVKLYSLWTCCLITAVTNTTTVTATVQAKVNNGCDGAIDGNGWAASTKYDKGTVVDVSTGNHPGKYICVSAGVSGSVGPHAPGGQEVLDGSVIWAGITSFNASKYQQSTFYNLGDIVNAAGSPPPVYYQAESAAKSYSGGSISGTSYDEYDGAMYWCYVEPFTLPTKTQNWRLGAWSPGTGYPYTVRFWQQRLFWGGFPFAPNQEFGSVTGDFLNHAPTKSDGTVLDTSALNWIIDDDKVQAIQALIGAGSAQAQQLAVLTAAGEQILQGASSAQALTPTSVQAYGETAYGSAANVTPLRIGKAVLFVDRTGRKLREWAFYWQMNGYNGPDLLQFSEHIGRARDGSNPANNGIADMAYQQAPHQVIWAITNDNQLLSFTYDRDQEVFAPMRHQLGGNYFGGPPLVESLAVIPSVDNTYDELWLTVLRTINGAATRTMEVMTRYFDGAPQDQAFFCDCALQSTLSFPAATVTPSGFVNLNVNDPALPVQYTGTGTLFASAGIFVSGDVGKVVRLNGGKLTITAFTDTQHVIAQVLEPWTMISLAPAASGAWSSTALFSQFSGLSHLNGETVAIFGDGAALGTAVVSGGIAVIPNGAKASFACIGLPSSWLILSMPFEPARAAAAASSGKIKRVTTMWARFHESLGVNFGRRMRDPQTDAIEDIVEPIDDRRGIQLMDNPPPIFSGIRELQPRSAYDREGQILLYGTDPLPATILSIVANGDVAEMTAEAA